MAGHNKWSKVKHIKAVVDAKKGKVFSKLAKELTLAAKHGGASPDTNARLRSAILNARAVNMPGDNIEMEIKLITPIAMDEGLRFAIREGGRTVGSGVVTSIIA